MRYEGRKYVSLQCIICVNNRVIEPELHIKIDSVVKIADFR